MKTRTKVLLLTLCAALLVCATVLATMAFLTDTAKVKNTFTVGNVDITLNEAKVTVYGKADGTDRVTENTYKLIPGKTYTKDPTVTVDTDSEDCYLFVKVENDIANALISTSTNDTKTIADQMEDNGWTLLSGSSNIYYQQDAKKADDKVPVFSTFTVSSNVADLSTYDGTTFIVTAYAVHAHGVSSAADAWAAANLE